MSILQNISFVIPSLGRSSLEWCLRSICSQMMRDDEIVVVDNSRELRVLDLISTGGLNEKVRVVKELRSGSAYALNTGVKHAKQEWIAFIDDDCVLANDWRSVSRSICKGLPDKSLVMGASYYQGASVYGDVYQIFIEAALENELVRSTDVRRVAGRDLRPIKFLDKKNMLIRKKEMEKILFDPQFNTYGEDTDFGLQWMSCGGGIFYDESLKTEHVPDHKSSFMGFVKDSFKRGRGVEKVRYKWKHVHRLKLDSLFPEFKMKMTKKTAIIPFEQCWELARSRTWLIKILVVIRFGLYYLGLFWERMLSMSDFRNLNDR